MHCEAIGDNFKDTFECKDHHKRIFDIFLKFHVVKECKKFLIRALKVRNSRLFLTPKFFLTQIVE